MTTVTVRPRFEGSNICTWIGFKHVMYLLEEAVLEHLRQQGLAPGKLYEQHGLGVEIVDSDARILTALHIDDVVQVTVTEQPPDGGSELVLRTTALVERPDGLGPPIKAVSARVRVLFRRDDSGPTPPEAAPYTVARIERRGPEVSGRGVVGAPAAPLAPPALTAPGSNTLVWRWRIPYFYCHYSHRLQHSGYLRLMEEVVDLFLAERGISIRDMVETRGWIPVVPRARVEILREALMEEELVTVFTVEGIYKNLTYDARMDCYVQRNGRYIQTATGRITHGYAVIKSRSDWSLVPFDENVMAALGNTA